MKIIQYNQTQKLQRSNTGRIL